MIKQTAQHKLTDASPLRNAFFTSIAEVNAAIEPGDRSFVGSLEKGIEISLRQSEINLRSVCEPKIVTKEMRQHHRHGG